MNQQIYPFKTNINEFTDKEKAILKDCGIFPLEKYLNLKNPFIFDYSKLHTIDNGFLYLIRSNADISCLFCLIDWSYMFLFGNSTLKTIFEEYQFINKRCDYATKFSNFCCIYDNLIWHGTQYNLPNEIKIDDSHYDTINYSYYQGKHYNLIVNFIDIFFNFFNFFVTNNITENNCQELCYNKLIHAINQYEQNPNTNSLHYKTKCIKLLCNINNQPNNNQLINYLTSIVNDKDFFNELFYKYEYLISKDISKMKESSYPTFKKLFKNLDIKTISKLMNKYFLYELDKSYTSYFLFNFFNCISNEDQEVIFNQLKEISNDNENILYQYLCLLIFTYTDNINYINFLLEKTPNIEYFLSFIENHLFKHLEPKEQKYLIRYLKALKNKKQLNEILTIKNNQHKKIIKI